MAIDSDMILLNPGLGEGGYNREDLLRVFGALLDVQEKAWGETITDQVRARVREINAELVAADADGDRAALRAARERSENLSTETAEKLHDIFENYDLELSLEQLEGWARFVDLGALFLRTKLIRMRKSGMATGAGAVGEGEDRALQAVEEILKERGMEGVAFVVENGKPTRIVSLGEKARGPETPPAETPSLEIPPAPSSWPEAPSDEKTNRSLLKVFALISRIHAILEATRENPLALARDAAEEAAVRAVRERGNGPEAEGASGPLGELVRAKARTSLYLLSILESLSSELSEEDKEFVRKTIFYSNIAVDDSLRENIGEQQREYLKDPRGAFGAVLSALQGKMLGKFHSAMAAASAF